MMEIVHVILIASLTAFGGECSKVVARTTVYEPKLNGAPRSADILKNAVSSVDCARSCVANPICRRFAYNATGGKCSIYNDVQSVAEGRAITYGRHCPVVQGFSTYILSTRIRCLKHYRNKRRYVDAWEECMSVNAHLMMLESSTDVDYLANISMPGPWVDGQETGLTWRGEPLQWTNWAPDYPRPGECVCVDTGRNRLRTGDCDNIKYFICEVDV